MKIILYFYSAVTPSPGRAGAAVRVPFLLCLIVPVEHGNKSLPWKGPKAEELPG